MPGDTLADRLRDLRSELGLTQAFVSDRLGIPRSAISELENGTRQVSANEVAEFARLYGTTPDYLLSGSVPASEPIQMLARIAGDLTEDDVADVVRFAEFLRSRSSNM